VFVPILLAEFFIYKLSVVPAYERAVYQEVSLIRKEQGKTVWLKGGEDPNEHKDRLDRYIAKKHRSYSVRKALRQIGEGFDDNQDWYDDRFYNTNAY